MPRKPRFFIPNIAAHVVQRGNNRQAIFFDDNDYRVYLDWAHQAAERYDCAIHAYVLMTNHVHILLTPTTQHAVSAMVQYLGRHYGPYINRVYHRSGTLWEGRFKAHLVQEQRYLLACYRYIELNPVRAGMVAQPGEYPWSSYRCNALGEPNAFVTQHSEYQALARTDQQRRQIYRDLVASEINTKLIDALRASLQTGTPLGNDRFREQIEQQLGRKIGYSHRGRPRNDSSDAI